MALFEGYERRIDKIMGVLKEYGINSVEECKDICLSKGVDCDKLVRGTQPICFENAVWAYTVGAAIAIKSGCTKAADAAAAIGVGLQAFCIPGSVAENRKVGLGHGNLGKMLLSEETDCFCFLAGHESFAAAEGAISIAMNANKVRQKPLRVILNGLGKDAAFIISRINGFTYVETEFDNNTETVKVVKEVPYSDGPRAKVKCYGVDNVPEGVAVMKRRKPPGRKCSAPPHRVSTFAASSTKPSIHGFICREGRSKKHSLPGAPEAEGAGRDQIFAVMTGGELCLT